LVYNFKKSPLVTVYITNYNYGDFIEQSIESYLSQDYENTELIIIDDGSTDKSLDIISKYSGLKNIKIIKQKNRGLIVSNNIALKLSKGKYMMRLDADDYLDKRIVSLLVNELEKDEKIALCFPDYYEIDINNEILKHVRRFDFEKEISLYDIPAHGACTLIRKKVLKEIGGYDENFTRQDGYDLWLSVTHKYKVTNVNLPLFYYRQHGSNLTKNESKLLKTRSEIINKHANKQKKEKNVCIGIIPTRGNKIDSRSNPLKTLGDKCLIDWTIESALSSKLKKIILTTPDTEVINHVKNKYGKKIVYQKRDKKLANINQSLSNTILDSYKQFESKHYKADIIIIFNIESPFKSVMNINDCLNLMNIFDVDSIVGVRAVDDLFYIHNGKGLVPIHNTSGDLRLERNNIYKKVGGLTAVRKNFMVNNKSINGGVMGHFLLDLKSSFSVDKDLNWEIGKYLIEME